MLYYIIIYHEKIVNDNNLVQHYYSCVNRLLGTTNKQSINPSHINHKANNYIRSFLLPIKLLENNFSIETASRISWFPSNQDYYMKVPNFTNFTTSSIGLQSMFHES